jgi:hypothetical protein
METREKEVIVQDTGIGTSTTERVSTQQQVGETTVAREATTTGEHVPQQNLALGKMYEVLWFITHVLATLLAIRFILLLFGANLSGIAALIYVITQPFVLMFQGIFPVVATSSGTFAATFEFASLLAIAGIYLFTMFILGLMRIFANRTVAKTSTTVQQL